MKIQFETTEVLSESDIRDIATQAVKEAFIKQIDSNAGMANISFFIYEGVIRDLLKDKEPKLMRMVNDRIDSFKLDSFSIRHHSKVDEYILNTIEERKPEFVAKANKQIDRVLEEEDWKYRFLSKASEYMQEVFISNMYESIGDKRLKDEN